MHYLNLVFLFCLFLGCAHESDKPRSQSMTEVLADAYEYGFPLVLMDVTRENATNVARPDSRKIRAPINQFAHAGRFPDHSFKDVVRVNVDTMYSTAWLDLSKEPMILEVPDTKNRYYILPILDGWTNIFSSPGKRTTGTRKSKFAIVGPNWSGDLPIEVKVIKSPTNMAWIVGRTEARGKKDAQTVVAKIQKGMKLYPLSAYGKTYHAPAGKVDKRLTSKDSPVEQVFKMSTEEYFNRLNKLMLENPPPMADAPAIERFAKYGIAPGVKFTTQVVNPRELRKYEEIPGAVREKFEKEIQAVAFPKDGWVMLKNLGSYDTDYAKRALVAYAGLGASLDLDIVYPTALIDGHGDPLNGSNRYVLHFDKNELPPVKAFWSLTVYGKDGYVVKNALNRYAIGNRSNLKYNRDGSLDIYIQNISPGKNMESNWLPIPAGDFSITARLYWPKPEEIKNWRMPPILKSTARPSISAAEVDRKKSSPAQRM
ncbi:DUF1254 domain-containing protein [Peredibacter starrii]|uniref:DUF1254 domain-containing protein n=1 Tax=Peredibacter starrii TaxID=28202 RepID=A0AAX4HNL1_9BACT|nr:DUF1254 domain-containing protein [Peredibacter starrii]WPU64834.1 DUF1254 domain-containing protein [Peredibacter starrii]